MNKKLIFYILGKSASGKDTILDLIMKRNGRLNKLTPFTTRPRRKGEKDRREYVFVSKEVFDSLIKENRFLDYIECKAFRENGEIATWHYGYVNPVSDRPHITIGTLDVYQRIKDREDLKIIPIYIEINDEERLYRMIIREQKNYNPNYRQVARRFILDNEELYSKKNLEKSDIPLENRFYNDNKNLLAEKIDLFIITPEIDNWRKENEKLQTQ